MPLAARSARPSSGRRGHLPRAEPSSSSQSTPQETPMRRLAIPLSLAFLLPLAACGDDGGNADKPDGGGGGGGDVVEVTADIDGDATWTADQTYLLKDHIFVKNGVLTIEPGTTILGAAASSLVITSSAAIDARGKADAPIVFTSAVPAGGRAPGDWGGVVLLGLAPINVAGGVENIEGFPAGTTSTEYGGTDDAHDCGTMNYVRIEFAGFELAVDNEL